MVAWLRCTDEVSMTDKEKERNRVALIIECIHCVHSKGCNLKKIKTTNCVKFEEKEGYKVGNK